MSNSQNFTQSSTSYSSYSTNTGGQTSGSSYSERSHTTSSGTTVTSVSQESGQPAVEETRQYDSQGRPTIANGNTGSDRRIEDVTVEDVTDTTNESDVDRQYRERMEDEYAKREGGA